MSLALKKHRAWTLSVYFCMADSGGGGHDSLCLNCTLYCGIYHILRVCNFSHVLVSNYLASLSSSFYLLVCTNMWIYNGFAHLSVHMWKSELSMSCVFFESFPLSSLRHCHSEDLKFTIKGRLGRKCLGSACLLLSSVLALQTPINTADMYAGVSA